MPAGLPTGLSDTEKKLWLALYCQARKLLADGKKETVREAVLAAFEAQDDVLGLPDDWEKDLVNSDRNDAFDSIGDILPGDDLDSDGISNLNEYIAGTYAFDRRDGLKLDIVDIQQERAHMRFLTITGRTYTVMKSTDGRYFTEVPFATGADSEATLTSFLAQGVAIQDLYIPVDTTQNHLYRLNVE